MFINFHSQISYPLCKNAPFKHKQLVLYPFPWQSQAEVSNEQSKASGETNGLFKYFESWYNKYSWVKNQDRIYTLGPWDHKGLYILCENEGECFGAKMKNKREGQFIDPFVYNKCSVMQLCSSIFNEPVNPEPCY